jgi:methylenetetrahydrofolate reductase (NADPH)|tara:strand:- start:489 stop:1373 length:885 start_codon:yes stop_codon:yes gene_type:complete
LKTFNKALNTQDFCITSEIFLRPDTNEAAIQVQADILRESVDAVLVTDNQSGQLHMSSVSAGILLQKANIDPIVQLSCRNRNRISLLSDLLGCAALGISNLMLTRGDKIPLEFKPRPKAIMDVNATELIALANNIKQDEILPSLNEFLLGGVVTAFSPKQGWVAKNLTEKIDAGAQFIISHTCLDLDIIKIYMQRLVETQLLRRMHLIIGTAILKSPDDARWLRENRPNVIIPIDAVERLEKASDPNQEGIKMCAEQLKELSNIPGISGAHIIAANSVLNIPDAVALSGIYKPN